MARKTYRVRETNMSDGVDLIHEWSSIRQALNSGRFDYLVDNGDISRSKLKLVKSIEELCNLTGGCLFIEY